MRLVQFLSESGNQHTAVVSDDGYSLQVVAGVQSVYELACRAMEKGSGLAEVVDEQGFSQTLDYQPVISEKRLLPPLTHPDPLHCFATGTGLTHLGSADTRNKMHQTDDPSEDEMTDSMKMFAMGIEGGKPAAGKIGVQPEWFYKGDGSSIVAPEREIPLPGFALDGGEEPEVTGLYIISPEGEPFRVGYALGNEYSDHVMEKQNYLYLAPSKIRACSFGPELLLGELPSHIEGTSRIVRDGEVIWEKPFVSGEDNMSHTIANLEYHHFKYPIFRQPGTIHCHYFGTATLSFGDGMKPQDGDVFEIECEAFGRPLKNTLRLQSDEKVAVKQL